MPKVSSAKKKPNNTKPRSDCYVAQTLDLVGDRWTLIIIRDMMIGKTRYGDFLASDEGITTNILAARLKRLESESLVEKVLYSEHPPRWEYHLTEKGLALKPVLISMIEWGKENLPSDE